MAQLVRIGALGVGVAMIVAALPRICVAAVKVSHLRVDTLKNPVGLDNPVPRFSWVLQSDARGTRQAAYQIRIASSPEQLRRGKADVWDSKRLDSAAHAHVPYGGPALASGRRYHVEIRVWDDKGKIATAIPGFFEMAHLDSNAWTAKWIGLQPASNDERLPFTGGRWIWSAPTKEAATAKRIVLRKRFTLAPHERVRQAELAVIVPSVGHQWEEHMQKHVFVNGVQMRNFAGGLNDPRRIVITEAVRAGDNEILIESPMVARGALLAAIILDLENREQKVVFSDGTWSQRLFATDKLPEAWQSDAASAWHEVKDLGGFGDAVFADEALYRGIDQIVPPVMLRKRFRVKKAVARARLYATAAGIYEAFVNGRKVGDHLLAPGWTDYHKRVRYQTFDVTNQLRQGDNMVGGVVASGWYSGRTGMGQSLWGLDKALFAQLHVEYKDGSSEVIATDGSWQGATGPWRRADLLDGELYDARRERLGWSEAGANKGGEGWRSVALLSPKVGRLEAQLEPPVKFIERLPTRAITSPQPGVQIFDLGQNMVGGVRLQIKAPAGTPIRLRYVEMLNKDGTAFTDALRTALATDVYIAKGKGLEIYEPRFTFHGFRYVEVSGHPSPLPARAVTGLVWHSALPTTGSFVTSNAMLNKLQSNILWGQKGNFISVPTDCPQRDERLGWTGDINMFARTATFNMDSQAFLAKYLIDVADAQRPNGAVADVAPSTSDLGAGNFAWGDVAVFLPWLMYEVYGDATTLERHYGMMKRWVDFRTAGAKNDLNTSWSFGDWVSPAPQTPPAVLGPIYHAQAARLTARAAHVLGKPEEARTYEALVERIRRAFQAAYVTPEGKIQSDTQSAYILALRYDMLPQNLRPAAGRHLVAAIERHNRHLNTGFLGTGNLLPALSLVGEETLAYELLMKDTMPSWLFTVKNGATTMWERWDGYSPETGPSNKGDMNSYNHYAFGAVGEWMYAHVAGLDFNAAAPGFHELVVRPVVGGGLTHARAAYDSIAGKVSTAWQLKSKKFSLDVEVPVHATARVFVPASSADVVKEGGRSASAAAHVTLVGKEAGRVIFQVGSGKYRFTAPAP